MGVRSDGFKDRVMGRITEDSDGGEDSDDAANPVSPFVDTDQGGKNISAQEGPEEVTPVGPGRDDLGNELKPFTCRKCGVLDHAPEAMIEIQNRWGVLCLPCKAPWRYKWRRDPETGAVFLFPTPGGGKPRSRLGEPERAHLESKASEMLDLTLRRDFLRSTILKMQLELSHLEPRLASLVLNEVPLAQVAVETIEHDPKLEQKQLAADLAHDICLAIKTVHKKHEIAAKTGQRTGQRTGQGSQGRR